VGEAPSHILDDLLLYYHYLFSKEKATPAKEVAYENLKN